MNWFEDVDPAGVAVFFGVIALVVAAYTRAPEHWGFRRIAFGVFTACAGIALLILTPAIWWWSGLLFGSYQIYIGWMFLSRRSRVAADRIDYLTSTAKVLSFVALADGAVSPKEQDIIRGAYQRTGFSQNELREVDLVAADCESQFRADGSDPERLLSRLKDACAAASQHSNHRARVRLLDTAVQIASSDGYVTRDEERLLRAAAGWLGLSTDEVDAAWRQVSNSMA